MHIQNVHAAFRLVDYDGKVPFEFAINQEFGITFNSGDRSGQSYLDMNPFNSLKVTNLFLFVRNETLHMSVDGVTFADYIYSQSMQNGMGLALEASLDYYKNVAKIRTKVHRLNSKEKSYIDY